MSEETEVDELVVTAQYSGDGGGGGYYDFGWAWTYNPVVSELWGAEVYDHGTAVTGADGVTDVDEIVVTADTESLQDVGNEMVQDFILGLMGIPGTLIGWANEVDLNAYNQTAAGNYSYYFGVYNPNTDSVNTYTTDVGGPDVGDVTSALTQEGVSGAVGAGLDALFDASPLPFDGAISAVVGAGFDAVSGQFF